MRQLVRQPGGVAILAGSSKLLVDSAVTLAEMWGVSKLVIGLTIVAIGTSAPELVTSLVAELRGKGDLGIGNLIGSGIFNVLGILGVTAIVSPVPIDPQVFIFDLPVAIAAAVVVLPLVFTRGRISRLEGALLLASFALYTAALYSGMPAEWVAGAESAASGATP